MSEPTNWRSALDCLADKMRELEFLRSEVAALRWRCDDWRARAEQAENAVETYKVRDHAGRSVQVADGRLPGDAEIAFGQSEDQAAVVSSGAGSATFLFGLLEVALLDDRPLYLRLVRKPKGELRAVEEREAS